MILQSLPHGQLRHERDAEALQLRPRTDARELQELRRIERAARQDHLALRVKGFARGTHARGAAAVEGNAGSERVDKHAQVRPLLRRAQVAGRGAAAAAAAYGRLIVPSAFLACAIEIGVLWDAERRGRVDERLAKLVALEVAYFERAADAVPLIGA